MEGTVFPGPEQMGTHPTLAHGMSVASLWPCAQPPPCPYLDLLDFTHVLVLEQVTSAAQSPSALQAADKPCQRWRWESKCRGCQLLAVGHLHPCWAGSTVLLAHPQHRGRGSWRRHMHIAHKYF